MSQSIVRHRELATSASQFSRREFLQRTALAGAGLAVGASTVTAGQNGGGELPTRVLGRTGAKVTILGLGTAPIGEAPGDGAQAPENFAGGVARGGGDA